MVPEERRHPTLHTLLVHTVQETARHAGHEDIIRESIDGAAGLREGVSGMPPEADSAAWKQHYDKLERIARSARPASQLQSAHQQKHPVHGEGGYRERSVRWASARTFAFGSDSASCSSRPAATSGSVPFHDGLQAAQPRA